MPANLGGLPQHILEDILRRLVSRDSPGFQPSVIRVSSAFYLAAIPTLYHSPRITTNIESFFLHNPIDPPKNLLDLSSAELLRAGFAKLAAFKHIRVLEVDLKGSWDDTKTPKQPQDSAGTTDEHGVVVPVIRAEPLEFDPKLHAEAIDSRSWYPKLPAGMMPNLVSVRCGGIEGYDPAARGRPAGTGRRINFAILILTRAAPKRWCQHLTHTATSPSFFLPPMFAQVADSPRPIIPLHSHLYLFHDFPFLAGGTTYVYFHPRSQFGRESYSTPTIDMGPEQIKDRAQWFSLHFRLFLVSLNDHSEHRDWFLENTRIIISGLCEPVPLEDQACIPADWEVRVAERIIEMAKEMASDGDPELLEIFDEIDIDVRKAEDMPDCPECGLGLGARSGSDESDEESEEVNSQHAHSSPSAV